MRGIDLGAELGAPIYVFWGGREGFEAVAAKPARTPSTATARRSTSSASYVRDRGYGMRFALEPKPNEPRGDILLPTVGHMLAFIERLDHPEMVGVNPEVAHETMAGLSFLHGVAQALWAGKLFHIDLNAQRIGRYDQDFRFGSVGIKDAFFLVKLLEESGYDGPAPLRRAPAAGGVGGGHLGLRRRLHAHLPGAQGARREWGVGRGHPRSRGRRQGARAGARHGRRRTRASARTSCSPSSTTSTRWAPASAATSASTSSPST